MSKFDDSCACLWRCVRVADQISILCECPAFAKHADANMEDLVVAIRRARPTETTASNNDQEDGSKKSQPDSKEFRTDGVERSAVTFFSHVGDTFSSLRRARIDHDYIEDQRPAKELGWRSRSSAALVPPRRSRIDGHEIWLRSGALRRLPRDRRQAGDTRLHHIGFRRGRSGGHDGRRSSSDG